MRYPTLAVALVAVFVLAPAKAPPPGAALVGEWLLDLGRTHYGPGVDRRQRERFVCTVRGAALSCEIEGIRADGRRVTGRFAAEGPDGRGRVTGIPEMDSVRIRSVSATIADAVFSFRGRPVYAYRAYRSADGRTLVVVAVDPATRAALNSVVVYALQ